MPRSLLCAAVAVLVLLGACATNEQPAEEEETVEVSGSFGAQPVTHFDTPLPMSEGSSEALIEGDGRSLQADGPALLALTAFDGDSGEMLADRGAGEPRTVVLEPEEVGEEIYPELLGTAEGSRLLITQPISGPQGEHMLVLVIDVLPTTADGDEQDLPDDFPDIDIDVGDDAEPTPTPPDSEPPTTLEVATTIRGAGPQVSAEQEVTLQYVAVVWPGGEVYDSTWADGQVPRTIAIDEAFAGLRDGLIDQTVGSRVVLLVPPAMGTGTQNLIFVVDVLATTDPDDREPPSGSD